MARIVISDNDRINTLIPKMAYEKAGHEVNTFNNGQEALEHIVQNGADIVITDLDMPIMDGVELLRSIKDPKIKKVLSSGAYSTLEELEKEYGKVECDLYFEKPIKLEDYSGKILNLIREQK